jgi:cell division protein FtsB
MLTVWQIYGYYYPPMLLSILLGIAVATITYKYLGGTSGSEFKVGALKLAGSSALLIGTVYFANSSLEVQMNIKDSVAKLEKAYVTIDQLNQELRTRKTEKQILKGEVEQLQAEIKQMELKYSQFLLENIKQLTPNSIGGQQILEMARKREGPFSYYEREFIANISIPGAVRDGFFSACDDKELKGERVEIVRSNEHGVDLQKVNVSYNGSISGDYCKNSARKLDLQLGCEQGKQLFPEHISGCSKSGDVLWTKTNAANKFKVIVKVLANNR